MAMNATCRYWHSQSAASTDDCGDFMTSLKLFLGPVALLAMLAACGSREPPAMQMTETPAPAMPVVALEPVQAPAIVSGLSA